MKVVLQWIVLVWTVVGIVYTLAEPELPVDEVLYSLIYSGLVLGLMISYLKK